MKGIGKWWLQTNLFIPQNQKFGTAIFSSKEDSSPSRHHDTGLLCAE